MWGRVMGDFGLVYSECGFSGKTKLLFIKFLEYSTFAMLIFGIFLPSRLLLLHTILCLLLIVNLDAEVISLRKHTYMAMRDATKKVSKKKMAELSNTVDMSISGCRKILVIMMMVSLVGSLYPDYSVYSMVVRLNDCVI